MRTPCIAGNIKMNLDRPGLEALLGAVRSAVDAESPPCDVVYCPTSVHLGAAAGVLAGGTIALGAQNLHWESSGAFTGEVSAAMVREAGCSHVILGHSERRTLFGETDEQVHRKTVAALAGGLVPIVCVGETDAERQAGATEVVLARQVVGSLGGLSIESAARLIVAYEPVWAIGTGNTATPGQAQEVHAFLRVELAKALGPAIARDLRILYGGSVKPTNAAELLGQPDIDGALVGGACLDAESFLGIIRAAG